MYSSVDFSISRKKKVAAVCRKVVWLAVFANNLSERRQKIFPLFFFFFFETCHHWYSSGPMLLLEELGFPFLNVGSKKGKRHCYLLLLSVWRQFSYLSLICFPNFKALSHIGLAYSSISV